MRVSATAEKTLSLIGVKEGMTVSGPVTLYALRNFDVIETQYSIKDVARELKLDWKTVKALEKEYMQEQL